MKEYVKMLIVDDEPIMRNLLLKILEKEGYQISVVGSAQEALNFIEENKVDLVLSDIKMPGMSGFDLLRKIKSDKPDIAVIMMTGYGDTYTVKKALINGADEYITKPFKNHEISLIVERAYWRLMSMRNSSPSLEKIDTVELL